MDYYKVFYFRQNEPAYWIGKANSKEDAIKRADVSPSLVYDVWLLDDWMEFQDDRRGYYKDKLPEIKRKKVCWASGFYSDKIKEN